MSVCLQGEKMKKQAMNPYLPLFEYVPDGEPHVFGDKIYIFGSHDLAGGERYCMGDYVSWSAEVNDLGNWKYNGISYKKGDDPNNDGDQLMWAPDTARGADGRYYMYYCFAFGPHIAVCVSDKPEGPYEFYGNVKYTENVLGGKELEEHAPFDPGIFVDDDGRVFLYYGFGAEEQLYIPTREDLISAGMQEGPELDALLAQCANVKFSKGAMCVELEADMLTAKAEAHMIVPNSKYARGGEFEGHGFYEASSMRKIGNKYYFIYSSQLSHELCYAISDYPDREFSYGGTLISNGDIGLNGNEMPTNTVGNNHGSIECINGDWYIFYHRQTHGTESSRQGCAEKLTVNPDGSIDQVEMTSCGLNNGPLEGKGTYPAPIYCNLISRGTSAKIDYQTMDRTHLTYATEEGNGEETTRTQFITNIKDKTTIGYKYFQAENLTKITLAVRGGAVGSLSVSTDLEVKERLGEVKVELDETEWTLLQIEISPIDGVVALFFHYEGEGTLELKEFTLQ